MSYGLGRVGIGEAESLGCSGAATSAVRSFSSCSLRRFFSLVFLNRLSRSSSESTHEGFMPARRHFSSRHFWQFFLDLQDCNHC